MRFEMCFIRNQVGKIINTKEIQENSTPSDT